MKKMKFLIISLLLLQACSSANTNESVNNTSEADNQAFIQAVNASSKELCETISNESYKLECIEFVESNLVADQAIAEKDLKKCDEAKNQQIQDGCKVRVQIELDASAETETKLKESEATQASNREIEKKAYTEQNPKLCAEIESATAKANCEYNAIIDKAKAENDASLCKAISDEQLLNNCKEFVETDGV